MIVEKNLLRKIKEVGEVKEFFNFNEKEIASYIVKTVADANLKISRDDAEFLVNYTRLDFANIKKRIRKVRCKSGTISFL